MSYKSQRICDRCGKPLTPLVFPMMLAKLTKYVFFGCGEYEYHSAEYDLCHKCKKEFEKFMEGGGE